MPCSCTRSRLCSCFCYLHSLLLLICLCFFCFWFYFYFYFFWFCFCFFASADNHKLPETQATGPSAALIEATAHCGICTLASKGLDPLFPNPWCIVVLGLLFLLLILRLCFYASWCPINPFLLLLLLRLSFSKLDFDFLP